MAPADPPTDDLAFLREYEATTLWKPQVVADNVLTGIFLADTTYRGPLAALLLQEAVEAARRNVEMQQGLGIATQMLEPAEFAERCPWLNASKSELRAA